MLPGWCADRGAAPGPGGAHLHQWPHAGGQESQPGDHRPGESGAASVIFWQRMFEELAGGRFKLTIATTVSGKAWSRASIYTVSAGIIFRGAAAKKTTERVFRSPSASNSTLINCEENAAAHFKLFRLCLSRLLFRKCDYTVILGKATERLPVKSTQW